MNLIEYGERFFDEVEIAIYNRKDISVEVALNQVSLSSSRDKYLTIIRGIKNKRVGIYIVDSVDENEIKDGINLAYKNALVNEPDEKWISLPESQKYSTINTEIDESLKTISPDFFVDLMNESIKSIISEDKNAMVAGGEAGSSWVENHIMNSHGIDITQQFGGTYFYLYAIGRQGNNVTPGLIEFDVRRDAKLSKDTVVNSILEKLKYAYNTKKCDKDTGEILMEPLALGELIYFGLLPAISGERKVKNTTPLGDKIGERVLDEKITIIDDPWHPLSTTPIIADDEGVATRRNTIFKNGVFEGFLWNSYWGNISGEGSTGNGIRNFSTGGMSIGAHNLVIENGKTSKEELIENIEDGFLISSFQGAHSTNPDTGDFSVVANPAFKIENGKIVGSTVFMMSGNIYSLLNSVEEISNTQKKIVMMGNGVLPDILFKDVKIAPVSK